MGLPPVPAPVQLFLAIGLYFAIILAVVLEHEEEVKENSQAVNAICATSVVIQTLRELTRNKRSSDEDIDGNDDRPKKKRKFIRYDRARAKNCVMDDYLGPSPIFDDKQFERVFQITRPMYQRIRSICCEADAFFRTGYDCTNRMAIDVDVKILFGLNDKNGLVYTRW
jgi:hypothetical protein